MIHPQLLVAPVPSVSHTCTQVVTVVLLYTGIGDLVSVKRTWLTGNLLVWSWDCSTLHWRLYIEREQLGNITACKNIMLALHGCSNKTMSVRMVPLHGRY